MLSEEQILQLVAKIRVGLSYKDEMVVDDYGNHELITNLAAAKAEVKINLSSFYCYPLAHNFFYQWRNEPYGLILPFEMDGGKYTFVLKVQKKMKNGVREIACKVYDSSTQSYYTKDSELQLFYLLVIDRLKEVKELMNSYDKKEKELSQDKVAAKKEEKNLEVLNEKFLRHKLKKAGISEEEMKEITESYEQVKEEVKVKVRS